MPSWCYFLGFTWGQSAVGQHFQALAEELTDRGERVLALTGGCNRSIENPNGSLIVRTWPSPRPTHMRDAKFLAELIRRHHPKCFVSNFGADNVMVLVGWLTGVPVRVAWYHTLQQQIAQDSEHPAWVRNIQRLRKRLVYHAATHLATNSLAACRDLQHAFGVPLQKCTIWANSLRDPWQDASPPVASSRALKVVCAGRFHPSKGQDTLIRAIASLRNEALCPEVLFLGDGPVRHDCEELARSLGVADWCHFLGSVSPAQVLAEMSSAAVTVVPSRDEAFGLVNIESLAAGTPVIASAVGGIPEIIRDGVDGFLVPPDDPIALASKLHVLLSDVGLRTSMGTQGRQRFLECFEQSIVVKRQADWLEALVAEAGQGDDGVAPCPVGR